MIHLPAGSLSASDLISFKIQSEQKSNTAIRTIRRVSARNIGSFIFAAALLLFGLSCSLAQAQTLAPSWNQLSPATSPSARFATAMAYDSAHGQVVMFGGFGVSNVLNDTWVWNGTNWTNVTPASGNPSARSNQTMVYDAAQGQVVMFGGAVSAQGSSRLNDTWAWNGSSWTNVTPASGNPPTRSSAAMAYDAAHGQVVLFGGLGASNADLGDTWVWNGTNWTNATPASGSPLARFGASMAYDAALGEVILFGGFDQNGTEDNDTWAWTGSGWTQLSPANSPTPGRDSAAMEYDAALGQVVLFGGENALGGTYYGDTWVLSGTSPSNLTWTEQTTPSALAARDTSAMAYDAAQGQIIMFGGFSSTNTYTDTWAWGTPQNFGGINLCPSGGIGQAPCNLTMPLVFNFTASSTTIGSIKVLTQGASNLDFTIPQTAGTNCINTWSAGNSCTVLVTFTPQAPGLRVGAVELLDNSGNLLVTAPIYGTGEAPEIAFGPAATNSASGLEIPVPNVGTANQSYTGGMTTDAAGNLYTGVGSNLLKVVPGGTPTTVATGFVNPADVAIDGAGNLYVADSRLNSGNGEVIELAPTCASVSCGNIVYAPQGPHPAPVGVAVDGLGDVFVADNPTGVFEVPAGCTSSSCWITVGSGWSQPEGVAVDSSGDLFVADPGLKEVVEIPTGCTAAGCQTLVGSGWVSPQSVAVDAAGDVVVADPGLNGDAGGVVEVPAGCTSSTCQVLLWTDEPASPFYVAVNAAGQVFVANDGTNPVVEINAAQPPSESFANTNVGSTSTQSFTVLNVGNQVMSVLPVSIGSPFQQIYLNGTPADCSNTGQGINLAPGQSCNLSIEFAPTAAQTYSAHAIHQDDSLNTDFQPSAFALSGTGVAVSTDTIAATLQGSGAGAVTSNPAGIDCSLTGGVNSGACGTNFAAGSQLTVTATPAPGSIFAGWGYPCSGTSPTCTFTVNNTYDVGATFVQQNFGAPYVCPSGFTPPAGSSCSSSQSVTFNMAATTTTGVIQVVTQGVSGLDFAQGSGSTCTGTIAAGNSCNVNVTFTPLAPGLRMGAVILYDNNGNQIASTMIYGTGMAPAIAFGPATPTVVNTGSPSLSTPNGAAVDAAGDLYIAVAGNGLVGGGAEVLKVAPNGAVSTVGSGLAYPQGLAVDGAGDLFIADNNQNEVFEVTPAGVQTEMNFGITAQLGVAVDGAGDVFVSDFNANEVVEAPPGCTSGPCTTAVYTAPAGLHPIGLAVDAAGDLFTAVYADFPATTPGKVVEIPAGCTTGSCQRTVGTGWYRPEAVAVDAAGDVFVADELPKVVEVPAGCASSSCQITLSGMLAFGIAVDAKGDVILPDRDNNVTNDPDSNQVVVLQGSLPPSLSFALTNVNSTSADSPQTVTVQNIGNNTLMGSVALSLGANFTPNAGTCAPFSLAPGATCSESFSFAPKTTGYFTASADFSDNTLNLSSTVVLQQINMNGIGGLNGQAVTAAVPNVVGLTQPAAASTLSGAGLVAGSVSTASSSIVPSGSVIASNPPAGTQVSLGSAVKLLVSSGQAQPPAPNPLSMLNSYFVTGDYAAAGVTLRGAPVANKMVTGSISIPASTGPGSPGVPTGADLIDGFLYWTTLENSSSPSGTSASFLGYPISGQQIGSDLPYTDPATSQAGTLRVYRADINTYFQNGTGGIRIGSGNFTVSLPSTGTNGVLLTEGASLVNIYRVLSPTFPLKAVVIYDGSAMPASSTTQNMQGFYDALGGENATGEVTSLFVDSTGWNTALSTPTLGQSNQFNAPLNAGAAYGAVILSTPVNNPDNDGILRAWKTGPLATDFHGGQPGYYDVKTGAWVGLPGAKLGEKDLFVQLDYMCGAVLANGSCDPSQENLFPSPDSQGNDPLAMVQQAFANSGFVLHLQIGNAVPESTCTDSPGQPCQFPGEPGVIGWKNSLEFSKVWPRNFASCAEGGDCSPRFPYGQKDSYHYVLFGHSLAIPAWNTRYGTLISITAVAGSTTTIVTTDRGTGINACPSRITISGIQGMPSLNGVYNRSSCPDTSTIIIPTPAGVTNWSYPNNTLPEPVIGITSGTVTSISGYSDLGGADSAVTLGLWETDPNQDMSKKATVIAGTLFHEIGHTIGLGHGGLYYDTPGSYVPTFEANCKPNFQSIMNYLFQLDGVGPSSAIAYSNQALTTLNQSAFGSVTQLLDTDPGSVGAPATFSTSSWYVPTPPTGSTESAAILHCDGTPLGGNIGYRVNGSIAPVTPPWSNGQNITFDGQPYSTLRGYNDVVNIDLRQVGATGGQFASLSNVLSFGSSTTPLNIAPGGSVSVGPGGSVALGPGGSISVAGGNVTVPSGGTITGGGTITFGTGGSATLSSTATGTITPGTNGIIGLPGGANVTLGGGGTITLGGGGTITLGGGGNVTLGGGGTITLPGAGTVTIPSAGGSYTVPAGGTITLVGAGTVTLVGGGNVTLGGGGTITPNVGGNVTLGGGGNVTLGGGGTITLGGGGNITLGGGGNVTLGGGGTITLGGGGNVTLGGGGNVTLGGGGTVTLGGGGEVSVGSGGNVTLGGGGTVTLGGGGNITLGGGGTVTLGGGGSVTLGAGGGSINGTPEPAGGPYTVGAGGTITVGAGGNITLGGGGTITLGGGGNVTLGGGGVVTLGGGGTITLGGGGNITLGGGGNVTLGGGGATSTELDYNTANSIVRPPPAATYTIEPSSIRVDWTAPAFGVVQTYTISRSVNGGTPVVIGSVSGVNGFPPATTFTDTNPVPGTLVYTISTTLVPDQGTNTQRQSAPSPPAVLTIDQTIVLGSLPSSVSISSSTLAVTATAQSNGSANNQLVSFTATGTCSAGSSSIDGNGVSSAIVSFNSTGSCTVTASQAGSSGFNAADPVSGTFMIEPANSNIVSQTITFPQLPNAQYGSNPLPVSATATSNLPVTFSASGPCNNAATNNMIKITGAGRCVVTASAPSGPAPNNTTYSAASVTQSFTIFPAPLTVAAGNLTISYGQQIPSLTGDYTITGFVNGESASVLNNTAPALSTTATSSSSPGTYPITVGTGTLAAANYSFLYVPGTLTIQQATPTVSWSTAPPASAAFGSHFTVVATTNSTGAITYSTSGGCTNSGGTVTMTSSTVACKVTASVAATANYTAGSVGPTTVNATGPVISVSPSTVDFGTVYLKSVKIQSITVKNTGTAAATISNPVVSLLQAGNANEYVAVNLCPSSLAAGKSCTITIGFFAGAYYNTPQTATLKVMDNAPGSPQPVSLTATVINPLASFSPTSLNFGTIKHNTSSSLTVTLSDPGATPLNFSGTGISITGRNASYFAQTNNCGNSVAAGGKCTITVTFKPTTTGTFSANLTVTDNAQAGLGTQTVPLAGKGN